MTESDRNTPFFQYRSYLLRLWREGARSASPWRVTLINLQTGDRRGFVDFEQLADFLMNEPPDETDPVPKVTNEPPA